MTNWNDNLRRQYSSRRILLEAGGHGQEIGVRIALGAQPAAVRVLIFSEVARFLLVGAAIGLPAAYALGRAVESILYGVHASDLRVFAFGAALMAAVSVAAAYPPARRAARTEPMDALRSE